MAGDAADHPGQVNHGTSMAETILRGLSSSLEDTRETSVKILPVDVYGQHESTSTFAVAQGVQAAIEAGADIISLSLGSDEQNPLMRSVIQAGTREGVLFFAAAGNEPTGLPVFPAAQPEVVGVTALNLSGRDVAKYANTGAFVEVAAPGAGMTVFNDQTYFGTGTSFSTAYVAGIAAGISSTEGIPVQQVRGLIAAEMKPPGP
jgi:subtilisin family serine protease